MNASTMEREPEPFDPALDVDERDGLAPGELPPEPGPAHRAAWAERAHEQSLDDVDEVTTTLRILAARQYGMIAAVLREAEANPEPWCGPDPTLDAAWQDPRGRSHRIVRAERRAMAARAAAADLAVRVHVSEQTVHARARVAEDLRQRCPRVWDAFCAGAVDERNAATCAGLAASLPATDSVAWAEYDRQVVDAAVSSPPAAFRVRARVVRERVHGDSIDARHRRAREDRGVWVAPELDGMATLTALLPADRAYAAYRRVDAAARHLRAQSCETRTLAQLRADVFADLADLADAADLADPADLADAAPPVHGAHPAGTALRDGRRVARAAVAVTVPVLTLLGRGDEPATLEDYGPIDSETARRLAGGASSWVRILTHPITGTVLDVDRTVYRVPRALRRWLAARDPVCVFPGCLRPARDCDIDHRREWHEGGPTSADNTAPLCRSHHVVKTETRWRLHRDPMTGTRWWISPTARVTGCDPPPW